MEDNKKRTDRKYSHSQSRTASAHKGGKKFSGDRRSNSDKFSDNKKRTSFPEKRGNSFGKKDEKKFSSERNFSSRNGNKKFNNRNSSENGERRYSSFKSENKNFSARDNGKFSRNNDNKRFASRTTAGKPSGYASKKNEKTVSKAVLDNRIETALQILIDVEKNGKYINLAYKNNEKLDRLEKRDRAYVMRILYGVTEKNYTLNWLLQKVLSNKRIKPWLNAILKIGTYQIYFMRIEDKEAIEQAKLLCGKYVSDELCGFVTAVLSKLSENKNEYNPETYVFPSTTQRLSVMYSYPEWLIDMWIRDYGHDTAMSLLESDTAERSINLRISSKKSSDAVIAALSESKINCENGMLLNTVKISDTVNIEKLDLYKDGIITAQGIGSMLTVNALDVKNDSTVLDTCAAPGGKTFYIAEKTKNMVESCDIHEHRVELIQKGVERLGLTNVNSVCRDMTQKVDEYVNGFDRVLIDAPCSGYGMINSKPDIKNNAVCGESEQLAEIQANLLNTCSEYVKVGGILVYSTCTVSKQENENVIKTFISQHPEFELIDISGIIPDVLNYSVDNGMILLLPSRHNADAFFISALRRK